MRAALLLTLALALPAAASALDYTVVSAKGRIIPPVQAGAKLKHGRRVQLGGGAKLVLKAGGAGAIMVKGPATFTPHSDWIGLSAGGVLSHLANLTGSFKIRTATALAAVRGTTFYMESRQRGGNYLCLCEGALEISRNEESRFRKSLTSEHHQPHLLRFNSEGEGMHSEVGMENHTDEEISELASVR